MEQVNAINAEINQLAGALRALRSSLSFEAETMPAIARDRIVARIWALEHKIEGLFLQKRAELLASAPVEDIIGPDVTKDDFVDPLSDYRLELKRRPKAPRRNLSPAVARHDALKLERNQSYLGALLLAPN